MRCEGWWWWGWGPGREGGRKRQNVGSTPSLDRFCPDSIIEINNVIFYPQQCGRHEVQGDYPSTLTLPQPPSAHALGTAIRYHASISSFVTPYTTLFSSLGTLQKQQILSDSPHSLCKTSINFAHLCGHYLPLGTLMLVLHNECGESITMIRFAVFLFAYVNNVPSELKRVV